MRSTRSKALPGVCEYPELELQESDGLAEPGGFHISELDLDEPKWKDGFQAASADEGVATLMAPMNEEPQAAADAMTLEQLQAIDRTILGEVARRWLKVARIIGSLSARLRTSAVPCADTSARATMQPLVMWPSVACVPGFVGARTSPFCLQATRRPRARQGNRRQIAMRHVYHPARARGSRYHPGVGRG